MLFFKLLVGRRFGRLQVGLGNRHFSVAGKKGAESLDQLRVSSTCPHHQPVLSSTLLKGRLELFDSSFALIGRHKLFRNVTFPNVKIPKMALLATYPDLT